MNKLKTYYQCYLIFWFMYFFTIIFPFMQNKNSLKKAECHFKDKIELHEYDKQIVKHIENNT